MAQIADQVRSIPNTATHVLVEGGINDLARGRVSDIVLGYAALLRSIPSSKRVIVIGVLPIDEALLPPLDARKIFNNSTIAEINAQIVSVCTSFTNCVPARALMSMNMSGKTIDGIHLTASAYGEWPAMLEATLR